MYEIYTYKCTNESMNTFNQEKNKVKFSQYFTPLAVADYMASLFSMSKKKKIKILDPGAGIGNLTLSFINKITEWEIKPNSIYIDLYEIDFNFIDDLKNNLIKCQNICNEKKIKLRFNIINDDFIKIAEEKSQNKTLYDFIIMNPPYKKLEAFSEHDLLLRRLNVTVPNYYAAFLLIGKAFLAKNGQMVSITPRSFCNGLYFKKFRLEFFEGCSLKNLHLFEKRTDIFDDDILQETVIMRITKNNLNNNKVKISSSVDNNLSDIFFTEKKYEEIIFPTDQLAIIRIVPEVDKDIENKMKSLEFNLENLGLSVSTGPIVDFRNLDALRNEWENDSYHMIYSHNIQNMDINFNIPSNKPSYIMSTERCKNYLRPSGLYVVVNRMSSKEEPSRIRAAIFDGKKYTGEKVGFDNKINYFHMNKNEINDIDLATGLWIYLNSTFVDFYFRTFSGNTQINATDLKENLKYPSKKKLKILGRVYSSGIFTNYTFDDYLNNYVF